MDFQSSALPTELPGLPSSKNGIGMLKKAGQNYRSSSSKQKELI